MKNTICIIGWLGQKVAYLNVDEEEAIKRFLEFEGKDKLSTSITPDSVRTFEFDDEFFVYDAWSKD